MGNYWERDFSHIENATMDDVKGFFSLRITDPIMLILVVAGNVETEQIKELGYKKWFGEIPSGVKREREDYQLKPKQEKAKFLEIEADVPVDALYKAYQYASQNG